MDGALVPAAIADFDVPWRSTPLRAGLCRVGACALLDLRGHARAEPPERHALVAAIADAHRAIDLDPDFAEAYAALALMLMSAKRTAEAVAAGRRSVALDPGNWRNHCRLGVAAWGAERIAAFERVLDLYPDFAYAYYGMAMVHVARDQLRACRACLAQRPPVSGSSRERAERFPGRGCVGCLV